MSAVIIRPHHSTTCAKMAEPIDLPFGLWTHRRAHWRHLVKCGSEGVCRRAEEYEGSVGGSEVLEGSVERYKVSEGP